MIRLGEKTLISLETEIEIILNLNGRVAISTLVATRTNLVKIEHPVSIGSQSLLDWLKSFGNVTIIGIYLAT